MRPITPRSSRLPKRFGSATMTAAASATDSDSASMSATPPRAGTVTTSSLPASAYVRSTSSHSGWTVSATMTRRRFVELVARYAASAMAVAPSYTDALLTSMPVSAQIIDWYSKTVCSVPWEISGWYGVYAVKNSGLLTTASTMLGTKWS